MEIMVVRFDDLWSPADPLPDGPVLREIASRVGLAWGIGDLSGRARIGYNPRMRTSLGRAFLKQGRVELNVRLLREHPSELLCTLVHELAHLAVYWQFGSVEPHGPHFRRLMVAAGVSARATHRLAVGELKRLRRRYVYRHVCGGCGMEFKARRVRRDVYCRACGPGMKWEVYRIEHGAG
jgi:predicted SprT family Zn-dependent metalloprotease